MGPSPLTPSSQVMKSAPPLRYAVEFRIRGTSFESHVSPCLTGSFRGAHESWVSSHRFGVINTYWATVSLVKSVENSVYGRTWAMQNAELGLLVSVTSSK